MNNDYIDIDGSRIYYEIKGTGEPLIMIHADSLDSRQWDWQFTYFSRKYQVIRYDIRGFGKSDLPGHLPYSFPEDLNRLMEKLKIKETHLMGLSLGGAIILDFTLSYPHKVKSLILADAGISGDGFGQEFKDNIKIVIDLAKKGKINEAKAVWSKLAIFDTSRSIPKVWERIEQMIADTSCYRWYGSNQPIDMKVSAVNRLAEIKQPTLILFGEHDIPDFIRKAKLLNEKIEDSQLVQIPNAGHLSNIDNPEIFNQTVESFLAQI